MQKLITLSLILTCFLFSHIATAGKKHCQGYRNKLGNVQAQQRQSNSNKRSLSLANKEDKARKTWWQCETGKLKPKLKKKSKKKKLKQKKISAPKPIKMLAKQMPDTPLKPLMPFAGEQPVELRSSDQYKKLQAWLAFYQPAKMCARPKSTQQFAACVEDKRRQQAEFENSY